MFRWDTHNFLVRVLKSPLGVVIARPWFDRCAAYLLERWFFPLSRLWAAARAADGSVDRFIEHVPLTQPSERQRHTIRRALDHFERCRLKAFSTEKLWDDYFFGGEEVEAKRLPIVEEMRLDFRNAYNMSRYAFRSLRKLVVTSVHMAPSGPEKMSERFGEQGERVEELFALPDSFPDVEVSRPVPTAYGQDYWIRFPSPSGAMNDLVYARVHEPRDVDNPPTLIFGHGICVEFDHYHHLIDEVTELARWGVRIIRPEAPWHGRRVLPGHYGGEQLLSTIPDSMFNSLSAQHHEWATIVDWVRGRGNGPVAIGGSSLGAQTAKAIAVRAAEWPQRLQPQALIMITHSQHIYEGATEGSLSDIWNVGPSLREKGWNQELEKSWLEKLDPLGKPCMPGENIVSVTGDCDTVTPDTLVSGQLDHWGVPEENRFHYRRGHFTVPLGMINNNEVLHAFAAILKRI